jgi:hypothetical protein
MTPVGAEAAVLSLTSRIGLGLVVLVAAVTQAAGIGHWVQVFTALGMEPWGRYLCALVELAGLALYLWPGRTGYGAAVICAVSLGAVLAHLARLGVSSAPPAVLLAVISGLDLRRHLADFRR